jgi:hypothetical protein
MRRMALCCLTFPLVSFAATKETNWKTGQVAADSSISGSEYTREATGPHQTMVDPHILIIRGDDRIYTVQEKHAWDSWCLLIQGDEIKYVQKNRKLYVVDAEGKRCRLDILSEEKRPSP